MTTTTALVPASTLQKPISKQSFAQAMVTINDPKQDVAKRSRAVGTLVEMMKGDITAVMPPNMDFDRLKQLFVLNVKQTPKLLNCDPQSLIKSLITAASMGLEPNPHFGEIYLLPYKENVQVIPGYKGLMKLVRNSGEIANISCEAIHENDQVDYQLGSDPSITHRMPIGFGERGAIQAFYCVATFKDGGKHIELMTKLEVDAVRKGSPAGNSGPWVTHYEEMGKKTVFRRAAKKLPIALSKQYSNAIAVDNAYYGGQPVDVDTETGEVINIWSEPAIEGQAEATPALPATSRLDSFATN